MAWLNGSHYPRDSENQPDNDELEPMTLEDIRSSLSERGGRFFHSYGPYPLPVDQPEGQVSSVTSRC